jgi:hypothetical protein
MKKIIGIAMAWCLLGLSPVLTPSQAQVYTWTDENGVRHYSNVAPSESAGETVEKIEELPGEGGPSTDSIERALQRSSDNQPSDADMQTDNAETDESDTPAEPSQDALDAEAAAEDPSDAEMPAEEESDLEEADADPGSADDESPEADVDAESADADEQFEEADVDAESTEAQNSTTQDLVVEEEKERTRRLVEALSDGTQAGDQLIENEKRRLEQTITELENQPLERFGSQQNKRRQIGFYQYRLQQLNSSPEVYLQYGDEEE